MSSSSQSAAEREAFVLGAGFSRALSPDMPLTDELGMLVLDRIDGVDASRLPAKAFRDGDFEVWLSRLADDQPHLSHAENLENHALFARVSARIRDVLLERQHSVLSGQEPEWLYELVSVLHARRTVAVSLNYDTLMESAVDTHVLWDVNMAQNVTSHDILDDLPPRSAGSYRFNGQTAASLRLLKLHGSLNWYWAPNDHTGATIGRWDSAGLFGAPQQEDEQGRRRSLPGRDPFIVPPATTKSDYYRNPLTRELWRRAYEALLAADRLVLVGYSLPVGDLAMRGLIEDAVRGREVSVDVVNPRATEVRDRLVAMGIPSERVTCHAGDDAVLDFVADHRDRQAARVVRAIDDARAQYESSAAMVIVSWTGRGGIGARDPVLPVIGVQSEGEQLIVDVQGPGTGPVAAQPKQLLELVRGLGAARKIVVRTPEGRLLTIVGFWLGPAQPAGESLRSVHLVPAGLPDGIRSWGSEPTV
jgi:hypothetical protein